MAVLMDFNAKARTYCARQMCGSLLALVCVILLGCSSGSDSKSQSSTPQTAAATSSPPPSGGIAQPTPPANKPPTITGTPETTVMVGDAYYFQPTASDPEGAALTFSVQNLPSWATFNSANGRITGTPTAAAVGTYNRIILQASDGQAVGTMLAFDIEVQVLGTGTATLNWTPPTTNSDGSTLTDLTGYRIVYGHGSTSLNKAINVTNAGLSTYTVGSLSPGTWYFALKAYNSIGIESDLSNLAAKTIL